MSEPIQAIYEKGILRLLQPLDLPENTVVEIIVRRILETDRENLIRNRRTDSKISEETSIK